jgi:uncharacterized protein (TIGR02145 family)
MKIKDYFIWGLLISALATALSCKKAIVSADLKFEQLLTNDLEELPSASIGSTGWVKVIQGIDTITYVTVRAADGNVWLQQNLGSKQVATSVNDTSAYGGLYQWGRWTDGHEVRNSAPLVNAMPFTNPSQLPITNSGSYYYNASPNTWWNLGTVASKWLAANPTQVSTDNGCDPCRALGNGWRLPYNTEWIRIIDREEIINIQTAFASNLKLPGAGHRNGVNGVLFRVGTRGYYWSSKASANNGQGIATHFWETSILPSNSDIRGNGFSVRCIKGQLGTPEENVPGIIIAHSPSYQQIYIGSPSIVKLSNGHLIASNDFFGPNDAARPGGKAFTRLYKSTNGGISWEHLTDISGQNSSTLFNHQNSLFVMGIDGSLGNVVIRKSIDAGLTWTQPVSNTTGILLRGKHHTAPTPVVVNNGRIWRAMEDEGGENQQWGKRFRAFMMSAPINANLLDSSSWVSTNKMSYDPTYINGYFYGWLEGNAVISPQGKMLNIIRVHTFDKLRERSAHIQVSDDGLTSTFNAATGFHDFPGGGKKFSIRFDSLSNKYWTLSNHVPSQFRGNIELDKVRNTLALCSSTDLLTWTVNSIIIQDSDIYLHGYQYVDWQFDGQDIVAVSRTSHDDGEGGPNNYHDANYLTFHRIVGFRSL